MEEIWPLTVTLCAEAAGLRVTVSSRTELTAMGTSATASEKPGALTTIRYLPGSRSSMRNSPRSSLLASRRSDESEDCATIVALAIRAPVTSCTLPRTDPLGLCPRTGLSSSRLERSANAAFFNKAMYQEGWSAPRVKPGERRGSLGAAGYYQC